MKLPRRTFLHLAAGAAALPVTPQTATAEQTAAAQTPLEPLVWPVVTTVPPGVPRFRRPCEYSSGHRRSLRDASESGHLHRGQSPDGAAR